MIFSPDKVYKMWDTWAYFHEGKFYIYYLFQKGSTFHGVAMAISEDGVHFKEKKPIITKKRGAEWLGSGSVWEADGKFLMNFSESRGGIQNIFFATSNDLIHWERLDNKIFKPESKWYDATKRGRWDCIWTIPKTEGEGYFGYFTAKNHSHKERNGSVPYKSIGMAESVDGLNWKATKPPKIKWGVLPQEFMEVGAITKLKDKYHLLLGNFDVYMGNISSMYSFVGNKPKGPFYPDFQNFRVLGSKSQRMTYFARFLEKDGDTLLNHHSITQTDERYLAPLKKVSIDQNNYLHIRYWEGNNKLKDQKILLAKASFEEALSCTWKGTLEKNIEIISSEKFGLIVMDHLFDLNQGIIIEGNISLNLLSEKDGSAGFFIEENEKLGIRKGTSILLHSFDRTDIGTLEGNDFQESESLERGITPSKACHFRLMIRQTLLEVYVDNELLQCYSLPAEGTGHLGFISCNSKAEFEEVSAWDMSL